MMKSMLAVAAVVGLASSEAVEGHMSHHHKPHPKPQPAPQPEPNPAPQPGPNPGPEPAQVCKYPGGQCYELNMQKCAGHSEYTMHGLWPQWELSCNGAPFNAAALAPIKAEMMTAWPSCEGETTDQFWEHEWTKHGTCSGLDQLAYFKQALALRQQHMGECKSQVCALCFSKDFKTPMKCSDGHALTSTIVV